MNLETKTARTIAALNASNEAILYAKSPEELYRQVCEAAFRAGDFIATAIFLRIPETDMLRFAAGSGEHVGILREVQISVAETAPQGLGLAGEAFRHQRPSISNDFMNDERSRNFREQAREAGVGAIAALPLTCDGQSVGVLMVYLHGVGSLDDDIVSLLMRMAANVSFSLGNFERELKRRNAEQATERISRMFAALSATNEAIMRAKSREDLFELVCQAAVHGARFGSTTIALAEPDSIFLRVAASTGVSSEHMWNSEFAITESHPLGRGLTGSAFRTRRPCVSNDFLADERTRPWHGIALRSGVMSSAVLPLLTADRAVGVLIFNSPEPGTFTPEMLELLERLGENVSFALGNFDRADAKAKADEQKERLTRMFAALSATNEAIMRAKCRTQLFELVCEAIADGGKFVSATIALMKDDEDFLDIVASAGPTAETTRNARLAIGKADPESLGISGTALRSGRPCISNDYLADPRGVLFQAKARGDGANSVAAFPLHSLDRVIGILLFISADKNTFAPEFVVLLQRLAANVSFALENFTRGDEKARADKQKESLSRMFEALSATNEAIMRAKSREELFDLVCTAAVLGGTFTSTTIVLAEPGEQFLRIAASKGRNHERVRSTRFAVSPDHPEGRGITGTVFRTKARCIMNDFLTNQNTAHWHALASEGGTRAGAGFPLLNKANHAVGVLLFLSSEEDVFTGDLVELLAKLAENVSFSLDNFDRAEEKTRADERIEYLASHDSLTNLPNRDRFAELLHFAIERAQRYRQQFALLFIDLDRFKNINDSLGQDAGDLLLAEIAQRLRLNLRSSDVAARLGGDEFVVLLENTAELSDMEGVARKLLTAVSEPLLLSGYECSTTASIGIAIFPDDGSDTHTLTKSANMAMHLAKEDGKNDFRFFTRGVSTQSIERLKMETCLRHALARNQFSLHYQPKVDLTTGQITGVEALLRWSHPHLGVLPPAQFIPLAEETGLIVPIGSWALKEACAQNMAWRRRGLLPISMAVNLSPRQFVDESLLQDIDEALAVSGMPPSELQLEVTESMVMRNIPRAVKVLDAIHSRGIRLAIDDFGTGYSSMSLMKHFPIDTIKIDRSFVRDLPDDPEDQAIAQAIISMGKALGMTVVAEGVETSEQKAFLRAQACDEMQGFLFSKPLPPKQLAELLRPVPLLASPPVQPEAYGHPKKLRGRSRPAKTAV